MDIEKVLDKVNEVLPPQPCVRFTVEKCKTGLFDCKIGGTPYFPKDMEYPKGKQNIFADKPLVLLAQLNFEKLPQIADFPTKGILQFYIAPDDLYGMSADFGPQMADQNNFRVIYHENIILDESKLMSSEDMPVYTEDEGFYMPFTGEYKLIARSTDPMFATLDDYRFNDTFIDCYNEVNDKKINSVWDVLDGVKLAERNGTYDAFIGGYPVFTQYDPRGGDNFTDCNVVLFELDSVYRPNDDIDIMWGDMGTGTFLIPAEKLKALDFSRVLYNYDCC